MPTPIPTLTPSNVSYLPCLKKFHTLAVLKQYPDQRVQSSALNFGNALHDVLADVYRPIAGQPPPPHLDRLPLLTRAAFLRRPYRTGEDREQERARGERMVRRYVDEDEEGPETLAVEHSGTFPVTIGGEVAFHISGRLDRVLVRGSAPDTLVSRDYKFGARLLPIPQVWIILALCKMLYPGYKSYALELEAIMEDGVERVTYRSADVKGMMCLVADGVKRYRQAAEYPAEPGEGCAYCPLAQTCQPRVAVDAALLDF